MAKSAEVGVIVLLLGVVRSDHRRGADEHFPSGSTFLEGALHPLSLLGAPKRFIGAVLHSIRRAEVASFGEPNLQMVIDAVSPVGGRCPVSWCVDGHLLAKDLDARGRCWQLGAIEVGIVESEIVIVFRPIGRCLFEEIDQAGEPGLLVPLPPQLQKILSRSFDGMVVVNNVAGADEEIRLQLGHRCIRRIAEPTIFFAHRATLAIGAIHEESVVLTTADDKTHLALRRGSAEGDELTYCAGPGCFLIRTEVGPVVVTGPWFQSAQRSPHDVVGRAFSALPWSQGRV